MMKKSGRGGEIKEKIMGVGVSSCGCCGFVVLVTSRDSPFHYPAVTFPALPAGERVVGVPVREDFVHLPRCSPAADTLAFSIHEEMHAGPAPNMAPFQFPI